MKKTRSQKTLKRPVSTGVDKPKKSTRDSSNKASIPSESMAALNPKGGQRSSSITQSRRIKKSSSRNRGTFYLNNRDNFCLQLLMEYPFNAFFVNFVCYIRDSLFKYFEEAELKRNGKNLIGVKEYSLIKEGFLDFEGQIEPMISILKDMCNTADNRFNDFIRNIIISYFFYRVLQSFMVPNDELEKMKLPQIKINHLFFAMTFFIQKFNDKILTEYLFKIFFSEGIDKSFFRLDKIPLEDPAFYSFEYKNEDIIGKD